MDSTKLRDKATRLAQTDAAAALLMAREVPDPWFRAQALAAAARWIEDGRVKEAAREALQSAESCDDDYKRAAVAAWPIRALMERGHQKLAQEALELARRRALAATPVGSQADALLNLLQGGWELGPFIRVTLTEDLVTLQQRSSHWRVTRALVSAIGMLGAADADAARKIAGRISDEKCRRKSLGAIERSAGQQPRGFF